MKDPEPFYKTYLLSLNIEKMENFEKHENYQYLV